MNLKPVEISRIHIPEFNGNKKLPPNEQIKIHYARIPGTSESQNYKGFKMDQSGSLALVYNDNLLAQSFITKIENLSIGDDRIRNGRDLATASHPALSDLFTEIRDYLFPDNEEMTEGESEA